MYVSDLICDTSCGVWLSGAHFFAHLHDYNTLDIITYTCNGSVHRGLNIRRLIVGVNEPFGHTTFRDVNPTEGYKVYCNVHAKLYIGWNRGKPTAYVGSHNFSTPRNEELMIRADALQTSVLLQYFNELWNYKHCPIQKVKSKH